MSYWGMPVTIAVQPANPIDTDLSTQQTIERMIDIARSSSSSPKIRNVVNSCLSDLPDNPTNKDLARKLFYWCKNNVRFVEDEKVLAQKLGYKDVYQELLIVPDVLLSMPTPMGDCDDYSMLLASLLVCAQIPCCFTAIAVDANQPERFSHVYVTALLDGKWCAMDVPYGNTLGWEKKGFRRMDWRVN
jgi:transglutaminase-like putative cysteine protease